jgi:hypothetical protein
MSYFSTVQFMGQKGKTARIPSDSEMETLQLIYLQSSFLCTGKDLDTTLSDSESESKWKSGHP